MNYTYQFPGVDGPDCDGNVSDGPADYSKGLRLTLDETALSESEGLCGNAPYDFNRQGGIEPGSISANINKYFLDVDEYAECGGLLTVLSDHDDWAAIEIGVDATITGGGGGGATPTDETVSCPGPP